ncbi:MAG: Gfo/Idh/MocA family oxidoreductase [Armatimonadetes bacterium]|nr:Gfo/Idh/MocA family oxidoreductase [Armatimonadota bacterium]
MAENRIRVGVAGLGRIGWLYHCKTLAPHPDYELAAVQDPEAERRREAEQTYGVKAYKAFREMLASGSLDLAVIATPTHLHSKMARAALRHGCHVMLEKPMARDEREARAILRTAQRSERALTVFQPRRAAAYFQHLRQLLASGKIGEVYHVRRGMFSYRRRDDWQSLSRYGGGMLNNYGAHALDQVLQIIGYDVRRVFCNLRVVASLGDADDVVKIILETRRGVLGEVDINQASATEPFELEVWGTRGTLSLGNGAFTLRYFDPADLAPKKLNRSLASADRAYPSDAIPWKEETIPVDPSLAVDVYADLARAIRTGSPTLVDPKEAVAVMGIIARCRADSGRVVPTKLK